MLIKIYAFIAAAFAILLAWLGIARKQRDKAREETEREKQHVEQVKHTNDIARARQQAQDEAKAVPIEKTDDRPTGNFGSDRL